MEDLLGLLRIRVKRGINLVVRDTVSSDPYVVITMGHQIREERKNRGRSKLKTGVVKNNCNPVWNDVLTFSVKDVHTPILLTVFDKDTFTEDDKMGDATIDMKPYIDCMRMGLENLPNGTKVERVQPNRNNCLSDESCIIWNDGKMFQDMCLRLRNVEQGEVEVQLEWVDLPGRKAFHSKSLYAPY